MKDLRDFEALRRSILAGVAIREQVTGKRDVNLIGAELALISPLQPNLHAQFETPCVPPIAGAPYL